MKRSSEIEILKTYISSQNEEKKKSFLLNYAKGIQNIDNKIIPFVLEILNQDLLENLKNQCKNLLLKIYINIHLNQTKETIYNLKEYNRFTEYKYFETNFKLAYLLFEDKKYDNSIYFLKKSIESSEIPNNWDRTRNLFEKLKPIIKKKFKNINIVFLNKYTSAYYKNCLEINCFVNELHSKIYSPAYGVLEQEIIDKNSNLYKGEPDYVLFALNWRDIFFDNNISDRDKCINKTFLKYNDLFSLILKNTKATIFFQLFDYPQYNSEGSLGYKKLNGKNRIIDMLNAKFLEIKDARINFVNPNIIKNNLTIKWFDSQLWFSFKHYPSFEATFHLCKNYVKQINAHQGKSKKLIILDLDNTIWGGVIGEDGISGIALGSLNNVGLIFYEIQCYLKELHNRGILLAICSKNNPEQVLEVFDNHPECPLKIDDFSAIKINWQSKSKNISEIKSELNIGYDSMVFIDDSPFEREEVRRKFPEISVINLPNDPIEYLDTIDSMGFFEVIDITKEDSSRNQKYKENIKREIAKTKYKDINEYLHELKMEVIVSSFNEINLKRIHQLINKTNQFNLTTKRYTLNEIQKFIDSDKFRALSFNLSDSFGDYGLVGIVIIEIKNSKEWVINSLLMSCRAIGRKLEHFIMDTIVSLAKNYKTEKIGGYYNKTRFNEPVIEYFNSMGFHEIKSTNVKKKYELNIHEYKNNADSLFNQQK